MDALVDAAAVRNYLAAVYPAARMKLDKLSYGALLHQYESLDYYYACTVARATALTPKASCTATATAAPLPFVSAGAYYRAVHNETTSWNLPGSLDRHAHPVYITHRRMPATQAFHSANGGRSGPAPSWTNTLALVRYIWFPVGLWQCDILAQIAAPHVAASHGIDGGDLHDCSRAEAGSGSGAPPARLWSSGRVRRLRRARSGDFVEVERFGGPLWQRCPPICGAWFNLWRGSGIFMRLRSPFVSLSKMTAIVEMILEIGRRTGGAAHLTQLTSSFAIAREVHLLQRRFPRAPHAASVAAALATTRSNARCLGETWTRHVQEVYGRSWLARALDTDPTLTVQRLLLRSRRNASAPNFESSRGASSDASGRASNEREAFILFWALSACGIGPYYHAKRHRWNGWDALLARLVRPSESNPHSHAPAPARSVRLQERVFACCLASPHPFA